MDSGPSGTLLQDIHERYGALNSTLSPNIWTESNADWDVFYPISALIETYRFPIQGDRGFTWPKAGIEVEELGYVNGVREMNLMLDFVSYTRCSTDDRLDWFGQYYRLMRMLWGGALILSLQGGNGGIMLRLRRRGRSRRWR
jgi:hypothetical protein